MAQAGFTPISLYYSTTATAVPTSGNLANGELAINITDKKLYAKDSAGTVFLLASESGTSGTVSSVAATVPAFLSVTGSPITTSGTLAFSLSGTALPVANGGTGQTSYTDGQLLIGNTTGNTLTKATLTAGAGITITNSSGAITIAAGASGVTAIELFYYANANA
jgi:trimeric autotransporter adhesin